MKPTNLWTICGERLSGRVIAVMMLVLTLCCVGCASARQRSVASVAAGPLGNAVLTTLPAGTVLQVPDRADAEQLQALFSGYLVLMTTADGTMLQTVRSLRLATPAYVADRDAAEMDLHRIIEHLRATQPRP